MILGLRQGKWKMKLEYLVVPGSALKTPKRIGLCQKSIETNLKEFPMAEVGQIRATN